jgi:hypothetical protein
MKARTADGDQRLRAFSRFRGLPAGRARRYSKSMNINEHTQSMAGEDYIVLTGVNAHEVFSAATHYFGRKIVEVSDARWGYAGIPLKFEVTTEDDKGRRMTTLQSVALDSRVWIHTADLTFA